MPNKATREAKALCQRLVSDPAYLKRFTRAFVTRKLPPRLEELVWFYAYDKPTQATDPGTTFEIVAYLASKSAPSDSLRGQSE